MNFEVLSRVSLDFVSGGFRKCAGVCVIMACFFVVAVSVIC